MGSSSAQSAQEGSTAGTGKRPAEGVPKVSEDQPTVISGRRPITASVQDELDASVGSKRIAPGSRLGHFELMEQVGGGGMGRVFLAKDTRLGRMVALKVLSRQQAADPETLLRFQNEARSVAKLNHENIAQVYYVGEDDGLPFIAFEFVDGRNVRDLVQQRGPLPLAEAISYTLQVAEALQHTSSCNVVHRDIKPSNVLITPDGLAKLIDLGLARLRVPESSADDLTASGVTLGTFDYISPEQARDPRNADVRSDIYSLGCTLFYMLAGRPPFPEGTVLQKLLQHQGDDPPDVRVFRPELPEYVSRLVRKMMSKDPRRRYQDTSKLILALLLLAEQVGLRPLGPGKTRWIIPQYRGVSLLERHLPWAAPIAVLVAIVLVLHMLWSAGPPLENNSIRAADESVADLPAPGELLPRDDEEMLPDSGGSPGRPPGKPVEDDAGSADLSPTGAASTAKLDTESPAGAANGAAEPLANGAFTALDTPNPLRTVTAQRAGPGDLRPGLLDGKISAVDPSSAELSMGPRLEPDWARIGHGLERDDDTNGIGLADESAGNGQRVLIIDPGDQSRGQFATLSGACRAAAVGDVIELDYNGRLEEEPLAIANLKLTIRSGQGFRPVVAFQPSEVDPIKYPRSMFTLTGSQLTLIGLALELDVPREVAADSWTMFEISRGEQVSLKECSLTIRNAPVAPGGRPTAYHPEVAFFRLKASPGSDATLASGLPAAQQRAVVELTGCVVRGEAVLLRTKDLEPVDLLWSNGLLATTEWLLVADGGERAPSPIENIRIALEHLTAVLGKGLCQLNHGEFAPHQLAAQLRCGDCILMTPAANPGCLVEQVGVAGLNDALGEIEVDEQDNFYEGFTTFWRIRHLDPDVPPVVMTFEQWQARWQPRGESRSWLNKVQWRRLPDANRPMNARTPADYALSDAVGYNPAISTAADGSNAGCRAADLPKLPEEQMPDATPGDHSTN